MAKSKLNNQKSEKIDKNFLEESPEGLPDASTVVVPKTPVMPQLMRFTFINGKDPGNALQFHYGSGTLPLKHYTLFHDKEHVLPLEVVKDLEARCYLNYAHRMNDDKKPEIYVKSQTYLYQFRNLRAA